MNPYKLRGIVDHIRRQGRLPTDRFGNVLSPEDLLVWFDLDSVLSLDEQVEVKHELMVLVDAEAFSDQWSLNADSLRAHTDP